MKKRNIKTLVAALINGGLMMTAGNAYAAECGDPCEVTATTPEFALIDTSTGTNAGKDWEIETEDGNANTPARLVFDNRGSLGHGLFSIEDGAPDNTLVVDSQGAIGVNTSDVGSTNEVEVVGNTATFAAVALTPAGVTNTAASGRIAVNTSTETFNIGVKTSGQSGYHSGIAIDLNADNNSLVINSSRRVGVGGVTIDTLSTDAFLHVGGFGVRSGNVLLDGASDWILNPSNVGLWFRNGSSGTSPAPVKFAHDAPENALVIDGPSGDIGLGTDMPNASLEVARSDGSARLSVIESSATSSSRVLVNLRNKGGPVIQMTDTNSNDQWNFRTGSGGRFVIDSPSGNNPQMQVYQNGNLRIQGDLTANGTLYASSRKLKEEISPVNGVAVLDKVAKLPVSEWSYKKDKGEVRHIGPMAEDFHAAFGLKGSASDKISSIDVIGVSLAAIKGLNNKLQEKEQEILSLKRRLSAVEKQQARIDHLEKLVGLLTSKNTVSMLTK